MPQHDVVAWTALVMAYSRTGQVLELCALSTNISMQSVDVAVWNAVMQTSIKLGSLDNAKSLFDRIPRRNVVSWNALLSAYAQKGNLDGAKVLFECMPGWDIVSWNILMAGYAQRGHFDETRRVFGEIPETNTASWNIMFDAYTWNGRCRECLKLFPLMSLEGLTADDVSFVSVLASCSHLGLLKEGWHYFISMTHDLDLTPSREHFVCMVDMLARAGRLRDAEELINTMPFSADSFAWGTLLGACRNQLDIERGSRAADEALHGCAEPGPYVLLSTMQAIAAQTTSKHLQAVDS